MNFIWKKVVNQYKKPTVYNIERAHQYRKWDWYKQAVLLLLPKTKTIIDSYYL